MSGTQSVDDRRICVRASGRYPLQLRSRNAAGVLESLAVTVNVSRAGLYTRLLRRLGVGEHVFGVVTLPTGSAFAARGHVVRVEPLAGGGWGTAIHFTRARLLASEPDGVHG